MQITYLISAWGPAPGERNGLVALHSVAVCVETFAGSVRAAEERTDSGLKGVGFKHSTSELLSPLRSRPISRNSASRTS
jgi:hypothetical protein